MASMATAIITLALALAAAIPAAGGDPPDCTTKVSDLEPCLEFIRGEERTPSADCCRGLQQIHSTKPECLCLLVSSSFGIAAVVPGINATLAQQVPNACNVHVNPSRCSELLSGSSNDAAASPYSGASSEGFLGSSSANSKKFVLFSSRSALLLLSFFFALA